MEEMKIIFPNNKEVNALYKGFTIKTDQNDSAPAPFDLFLASLGTCSGIYVLNFIKNRKLSTEGLEINMSFQKDEKTRQMTKINMDIKLPKDFPPQYKDAIIKSANLCPVKKHLHTPPEFEIKTN